MTLYKLTTEKGRPVHGEQVRVVRHAATADESRGLDVERLARAQEKAGLRGSAWSPEIMARVAKAWAEE